MKVLVVCSGNAENFSFEKHQAFIYDQIEAICRYHTDVEYNTFLIKGKGFSGYLRQLPQLKAKIKDYRPHIVHAHGGHTGLLCSLQRSIPVIATFHGSDINVFRNRIVSIVAALLNSHSIFVSRQLKNRMPWKMKRSGIIPCGVDMDLFSPMDKNKAKALLGLPEKKKYILFSSSFDNQVKNFPLAQKALSGINDISLIEIKDRTREEVNLLINGAELLLMTSFSEGSPQVIKEAMACNYPIVSTDVGDVRDVIGNTAGCYITSFDPEDVADKIKKALAFGRRTNGREKIGHLDNRLIAARILEVYKDVLKRRKSSN